MSKTIGKWIFLTYYLLHSANANDCSAQISFTPSTENIKIQVGEAVPLLVATTKDEDLCPIGQYAAENLPDEISFDQSTGSVTSIESISATGIKVSILSPQAGADPNQVVQSQVFNLQIYDCTPEIEFEKIQDVRIEENEKFQMQVKATSKKPTDCPIGKYSLGDFDQNLKIDPNGLITIPTDKLMTIEKITLKVQSGTQTIINTQTPKIEVYRPKVVPDIFMAIYELISNTDSKEFWQQNGESRQKLYEDGVSILFKNENQKIGLYENVVLTLVYTYAANCILFAIIFVVATIKVRRWSKQYLGVFYTRKLTVEEQKEQFYNEMRKSVLQMMDSSALQKCELCHKETQIEQQFEPCGHKCVCSDCEMPPSCPRCKLKIMMVHKVSSSRKDTLEGAETGRGMLEPVIIQNFILSDPSALNSELLKKLVKAKKQTIVGLENTEITNSDPDAIIRKNSTQLKINRTVEADGRLESKDESVRSENWGDSSTFTEDMPFDTEANDDNPNANPQQALNPNAVQISPLGFAQEKAPDKQSVVEVEQNVSVIEQDEQIIDADMQSDSNSHQAPELKQKEQK